MRTFLAVLDRGGFTAASEQVHRSQSRVSAHVAALERELGVTLIDRSRRPARVTHAGEVLAGHAREILAAVGSARSAVGAARGLDEGRLTLLTTPCLGAAFLPGPLSRLAAARPEIRFTVLEDGRPDVERRFLDDGVAFAVLPALAAPAAPGLQERILWHEAVCALVPAAHPLATRPDPVSLRDLVREPLVLIGAPGEGVPEVVDLLARHGEVVIPTATADCPATVGGTGPGGDRRRGADRGRRARCPRRRRDRPGAAGGARDGPSGQRLLVRRPAGHRTGPGAAPRGPGRPGARRGGARCAGVTRGP